MAKLMLRYEVPLSNSIPKVGEKAPTFTLPSSTGGTIDLAELAGRQRVVLYFYPKANTPGCTRQACGFRDTTTDFAEANVAIIGISPDPISKVTRFANKYKLKFPLLADEDHSVCDRYGLWQQKSMFGHKYMGVLRTTFIIARGGVIEYVFEKVKPEGHETEVLEAVGSRR
jgi:peroxiredoxin Q/BCP